MKPSIRLDVKPVISQSVTHKDIKLIHFLFRVESKDSVDLVIDWKAFTRDCFYKESEQLIDSCKNDLTCIQQRLKFSEFIIENEDNSMNFITSLELPYNKVYPIEDVNCMEDWSKVYELYPKRPLQIKTPEIFYDYISSNHKKVKARIHYLFIPTGEQKKSGYSSITLSSKWFEINSDD